MKPLLVKSIAWVIAGLNLYYIGWWLVVFDKSSNQSERVALFLERWLFFDSLAALNVFLMIITIASLVVVNTTQVGKVLRVAATSVYLLFLLYCGLSYL